MNWIRDGTRGSGRKKFGSYKVRDPKRKPPAEEPRSTNPTKKPRLTAFFTDDDEAAADASFALPPDFFAARSRDGNGNMDRTNKLSTRRTPAGGGTSTSRTADGAPVNLGAQIANAAGDAAKEAVNDAVGHVTDAAGHVTSAVEEGAAAANGHLTAAAEGAADMVQDKLVDTVEQELQDVLGNGSEAEDPPSDHVGDLAAEAAEMAAGAAASSGMEAAPSDPGQSSTESLKLLYFPGIRGRAELPRLIMNAASVTYTEELIEFSDWANRKEETPFGALPLLYVNGTCLAQSRAIARYLAKEYGLAGADDWEMAKADEIIDLFEDVKAKISPKIRRGPDLDREAYQEVRTEAIVPFMDVLNNILMKNDTGWLVGKNLTWADLAVVDTFVTLEEAWDDTLLVEHPLLREHIKKVKAIPEIQQYLARRPVAVM